MQSENLPEVINNWAVLNKILVSFKITIICLSVLCVGFLVFIFYLMNQDPLVIGLEKYRKEFFSGERKSIEITEADVSRFSEEFVRLRYTWGKYNIPFIINNISPFVTSGLRKKLEKALEKGKATVLKQKISQRVLINKVRLDKEKVHVSVDRIIKVGEKVKVVNPLDVSLNIIQGSTNKWNHLGLYVNGITEHEEN